MLIRGAEVWGQGLADVRIDQGRIAEIAPSRPVPLPGTGRIIDAMGGALLPGLHDHHIHLAGLAARASSVWCGPPEIGSAEALAARLSSQPGKTWLRGIGYHESVMGLPDAKELDRLMPDRPLRIQHRSGRMWLLNSRALAELLSRSGGAPPGMERSAGGHTGRLFDEDTWLRRALGSQPPEFGEISTDLARFGVTGITDMSPRNDGEMARHVSSQVADGSLSQRCWLAGELSLADAERGPWRLGPAKLHLHEAALPAFEDACAFIAAAHGQQRAVAVHCVSEVELVFALALFDEAGSVTGDRIEHASVASADLIERIAAHGIAICVQPHFVQERGDRYLIDVERRHHGDLYRLASLSDAGIALAGGSDAPFAGADPWEAMAAAVSRRTREGQVIGAEEGLTPEQALALYLAAPGDLPRQRRIAVGDPADLCLLDRPWAEARVRLNSADVRATLIAGRLVHDGIGQPPA